MKYEYVFGKEYGVRPLRENELYEEEEKGFHVTDWAKAHARYFCKNMKTGEEFYLPSAWKKELRAIAKGDAKRDFRELLERAYEEGIDPEMDDRFMKFMDENDLYDAICMTEFLEIYKEFCEKKFQEKVEEETAEEIVEENPEVLERIYEEDRIEFFYMISPKFYDKQKTMGFDLNYEDFELGVYLKLKRMAEEKKKEGANDV